MSKAITVRVVAEIRRVSDGVTRLDTSVMDIKDDDRLSAHEGINYMWTDGNYGCDCNRHLLFLRAGNEPEEDIICSDDLYRVKVTDADTGSVIVDEFDDAEEAS